MAKRPFNQYRGHLSAGDIAAGMNAARRNAARLLEDAKLLLDAGRIPTACSVAILAIEEAGKVSIFRELATVGDDKQLKETWRRYRNHRAKNVMWIIGELAKDGARTLEDMRPIQDDSSDHPEVLDAIKQLGFYTDCYKHGLWSEPLEVIDEALARSMVSIAGVLCKEKQEISQREIELWIQHVGPYIRTPLAALKVVEFHKAMLEEGLTEKPLEEMRKFVLGE